MPTLLLGLAAAFVVVAIGIPGLVASVTVAAAVAAWLQTALVIVVIRRLALCPTQTPGEWMVLLLIVAVGALAFGGVTAALGPWVPLWWSAWVSGSLWGVATFAPLALTFARPTLSPARRVVEYLLIVTATVGAMFALFWFVTPGQPGLLGWPYLVIVGLVWLAVRFGVQGLAPVLTLLGCSGLIATVVGRGAFAAGAATIEGRALVFEVFLIVIGTAALLLALITDQRATALAEVSSAQRLLGQVIEAADSPIFAKSYQRGGDGNGRYILTNSSWAHAVGDPIPDEHGELRDEAVFPATTAQVIRSHDEQIMRQGRSIVFHERVRDVGVDGREFLTTKFPLTDSAGQVWGVGGVSTDVTELSHAKQMEEQQSARMAAVFEFSPTPTMRCLRDASGHVTVQAANRATTRLLGCDVTGFGNAELMRFVREPDLTHLVEAMNRVLHGPDDATGALAGELEVTLYDVHDRPLAVVWTASRVGATSDGGIEFVIQLDDITRRKAAERALEKQAVTDGLTGLPNRTALRGRLQEAVERLAVQPGMVAVLFCDLDEFKEVNDTQGHQAGDDLLVALADRMRAAAGPGQTVTRMGGDEFVVVCEGLRSTEEAITTATHFARVIREPLLQQRRLLRITTSIGLTVTDNPDESVDELLRRADLAMFAAKREGPDRVKRYDEDLDTRLRMSMAIQDTLRRHVYGGTLQLQFQPVHRLSDSELVGAEALVRLPGTDGGFIPPDQFIPQAEASGLITDLDRWVMDEALQVAADWHAHGHRRQMSMNVSPIDLRRTDFAQSVLASLARHDLPATTVTLEITETALLRDREHVLAELAVLRQQGVRVALDDFGTGYSSLSWLTDLTVDAVKIDKSFVATLGHDPTRTAVVRAVLSVASDLGLTVTAEGVEHPEQLALLRQWGCELGQGYLFSRPVAATDQVWDTSAPAGN